MSSSRPLSYVPQGLTLRQLVSAAQPRTKTSAPPRRWLTYTRGCCVSTAFAAAAYSIHLGKVGQFMVYANTIFQAYIQFEEMAGGPMTEHSA